MVPQTLMKWNASGNWFSLDSLMDSTTATRVEILDQKNTIMKNRCELVVCKSVIFSIK